MSVANMKTECMQQKQCKPFCKKKQKQSNKLKPSKAEIVCSHSRK